MHGIGANSMARAKSVIVVLFTQSSSMVHAHSLKIPKIRYTIEHIEFNRLQNPWRVNSSIYLTCLWCREELRLKTRNVLYPPHLFKGIIWTRQWEIIEEKTTSSLPKNANLRVGWGYIDIKFNASRLAGNRCLLATYQRSRTTHWQSWSTFHGWAPNLCIISGWFPLWEL